MIPLLWSPQAREDLLDIYLTVGLDNKEAAELFTPPSSIAHSSFGKLRAWAFVGRRLLPPPGFSFMARTSCFIKHIRARMRARSTPSKWFALSMDIASWAGSLVSPG